MKKISYLLASTALLMIGSQARADSLLEVYQQALQSDPLIHEAEARRLATLEAVPQARAGLLPQLNLSASYGRNQSDTTSPENYFFGGQFIEGTQTTDVDQDATIWNVNLNQTVFSWDQVVGLKQAHKRVAKAEADREAAQQELILRVTTRYFAVLAAEDRLTSINADRLAIARQLEQAKQRFEVGLIAITDVQESQAAYDQSVASEIAAKRDLATAREYLREITGQYVRSLSAVKEDFPLRTPEPASEADWVDQAMSQNLGLVASRLDEEIARAEVAYRRTGHYPKIELVASMGSQSQDGDVDVNFDSSALPSPITDTWGIDSTSDRNSIAIQLSVPLFAGGRTSSRVREAVHLHRASREQLQRVARETERATRDAYLGVLSEISRVNALKQAVASSRTALEATEAGFEVGTRTIVDVLNSQRSVYNAITNYYAARYDYVINVLKLKQAAGTLRIQDLEQVDRWLEDRRPPEEIINQQG